MKLRCLAVFLCLLTTVTLAADHKLGRVESAPDGLSPDIAKLLDQKGYQINGSKGPVAEIWWVQEIALKDGFKPSLGQMYPFQAGQLLGALRVTKGADFTDFRNQQIKAGVYTLRFGLQPSDGNHVGTSETSDFVLALPAAVDTKTDAIKTFQDLTKLSAKASGATHPAIFSLVDAKKAGDAATLEKHGAEHWVLSVVLSGKNATGAVPVKLRLIVVGHAEG